MSIILPDGVYSILNGNKFACNFPDSGTHPPFITGISFAGPAPSGPYSQWTIKHVGEGAYSITNYGSGYHAFVQKQEPGASVDGNSGKGVHFAIERAGGGEYVIKTVNRDLDWTVKDDQWLRPFLEHSGKGASQHFRFDFVRPNEN